MTTVDSNLLTVGRISGVYGVRGWVRIYSHTDPVENILGYAGWQARIGEQWRPLELVEGRTQGKGIVVHLKGVDDRDQARQLIGADIAIPRSELPPAAPGEFYWLDLQGLRVETLEGIYLGNVAHLFETGANDVMVVRDGERERLLPFVREQYIKQIDFTAGRIVVDWDPEF
jgi:16S rRNA processing protein RimM